jgi:16S rRNA (cytosine1402-N4)-methyltransferase
MTPETYHIPVMLRECMEYLATDPEGVYVDGTLGAGGHSAALLERLGPKGRVIGVDQDPEAIEEATSSIKDDRFEAVMGNFGYIGTIVPPEDHGNVAGVLLDLGVSSHQIDDPARGFSFRESGPLDMRMLPMQKRSAADVVNNTTYEELRDILYQYGEERKSGLIAKRIIERRPLGTTDDLRACVEEVVRGPHTVKSLARVFQAIRIEVNRELEMLKSGLESAAGILKPGGRLVVMSYHSLEDRLVKNYMKAGNFSGKQEKDFYGNLLRPLRPLFNKPQGATEQEIARNPRSRSARLRAAEKLAEGKGGSISP